MIDAKSLFDRFLGSSQAGAPSPGGNPGQAQPPGGLADMARQALQRAGSSGMGGFGGGAAAGGILGLLLGGKSMRRGGGLISHGGAAVLGALAHRAWQNWQAGQTPAAAPLASPQDAIAAEPRNTTPALGGEAFELSLIRAMIGAARADGHIDAEERARIFAQVDKAGLDAEAKAFIFDALETPVSISDVAAAARTREQASEIYLVSRLAVDPDHPAERAYLDALAHRLGLPEGLAAHLDHQVAAAPGA